MLQQPSRGYQLLFLLNYNFIVLELYDSAYSQMAIAIAIFSLIVTVDLIDDRSQPFLVLICK